MAIIIVSASSCNNRPSASGAANNLKLSDTTVSTVLYKAADALKNIAIYDTLSKKYLKMEAPINSFTINAVDLMAALGIPANTVNPKFNYVRAILGFDSLAGFKLFLVPVVGANLSLGNAGRNVYLNSNGIANDTINSANFATGNEYVLDLNAPCPKTCPPSDAVLTPGYKKP